MLRLNSQNTGSVAVAPIIPRRAALGQWFFRPQPLVLGP
jgi:hypothetical protein